MRGERRSNEVKERGGKRGKEGGDSRISKGESIKKVMKLERGKEKREGGKREKDKKEEGGEKEVPHSSPASLSLSSPSFA